MFAFYSSSPSRVSCATLCLSTLLLLDNKCSAITRGFAKVALTQPAFVFKRRKTEFAWATWTRICINLLLAHFLRFFCFSSSQHRWSRWPLSRDCGARGTIYKHLLNVFTNRIFLISGNTHTGAAELLASPNRRHQKGRHTRIELGPFVL